VPIRDAMLAVSGDCNTPRRIGSAVAMAGDGMINGPRGPWELARGRSISKTPARSVYLADARDAVPESLALFDFAENSLVTGRTGDDQCAVPGALHVE